MIRIGVATAFLLAAMPLSAASIDLVSPGPKTANWNELLIWKDVPNAKSYTLELTYPLRMFCRLPDGKQSIQIGGGTMDWNVTVVKSDIPDPPQLGMAYCSGGQCKLKAPGAFPKRGPEGNRPNGACNKGDPYVYQWALRDQDGNHSKRQPFTLE